MSVIRPSLSELEILRRVPAAGAFVAFAVTLLCLLIEPSLGHAPMLLVYIAALVLAGPSLDRAGVIIQAGLSALAWDFFFTEPRFSFRIAGHEDIAMLTFFAVVTFAVARLARSARDREMNLRRDDERRRALHEITRDITSGDDDTPKAVAKALRRLGEAYDAETAVILFAEGVGRPVVIGDKVGDDIVESARWAMENRLPVTRHVEIPEEGRTQDFVLPMTGAGGVLHLRFRSGEPDDADRAETLRIVARLLALVLDRKISSPS